MHSRRWPDGPRYPRPHLLTCPKPSSGTNTPCRAIGLWSQVISSQVTGGDREGPGPLRGRRSVPSVTLVIAERGAETDTLVLCAESRLDVGPSTEAASAARKLVYAGPVGRIEA